MSVRKKIVTTKGEDVTWWIADYSDGNGDRHQRRFPTKREAVAFIEPLKVAVRAGTHVSLPSDLTVRDACDKWLKRCEANGLERGSIKTNREHVLIHIVPRIGNQRLSKFTKGHVEHFRDSLLVGDKALTRPTARKVLVSFKAVLKVNGCAHLGDGVSIRIAKRDRRLLEVGRDIPTPEEISRLVKAATGRTKVLLMVAASTGLRASELRGLRWSDVDLKTGELHVRQRADRWNAIGSPKTDGSRRTLPLAHDLVAALREWKAACPISPLDLVFPSDSGAVMHHKVLLQTIERVMWDAHCIKNAAPKYALHAFRHFFASWLINDRERGGRGLSAKQAQTLLGHSSIVMTMDRYGHLFPKDDDRAELDRSAKALFG
jgi:integrase